MGYASVPVPARPPQEIPMKRIETFAACCLIAAAFATTASAQTKWDMPTAYAPTNFHTENIAQFIADVDKATAGKLKIQLHANASLFKMPEIKRSVQGGQAQIGEILISAYSNEDPIFGVDSVPFLATSIKDADKLWKASRKAIEDRFAKQGLVVLYAVPWPPQGIYSSRTLNSMADMKGLKMRTYNPYTARIAELAGAQSEADFRKVGETMTSEWMKTAGPDGQAIVDAYKK